MAAWHWFFNQSFAALAIGIFISTFSNSEFQMMQFIPIVVVLQIFFCGLVSLNSLPHWIVYFSKILPLTYASDALSDVVLKGADLIDILPDLLGLIIFIVLFAALNVWGLKRYHKT
ncbi:ABC transporter permease [Limosilactobacillus mucosae]